MGGICTRREANGRGDVKAEPKIKTLENDNKTINDNKDIYGRPGYVKQQFSLTLKKASY